MIENGEAEAEVAIKNLQSTMPILGICVTLGNKDE